MAEYITNTGKHVSQYDVFVSGSQLKGGEQRKTMTGYQITHNGKEVCKRYSFMACTSLPKAMLQTVVEACNTLSDSSVIYIHTADSFTEGFINCGWSGPKTQEEANMIMEQRKKHICILAIRDNSAILSKITNNCRRMMYK